MDDSVPFAPIEYDEKEDAAKTGCLAARELLSQAMTALDGVRPAILPSTLEEDLGSLLGFRYFFRHAYGAELDAERLRIELRRLTRTEAAVAAALDGFVVFLEATEHALRA